jgi:hypothetical protein
LYRSGEESQALSEASLGTLLFVSINGTQLTQGFLYLSATLACRINRRRGCHRRARLDSRTQDKSLCAICYTGCAQSNCFSLEKLALVFDKIVGDLLRIAFFPDLAKQLQTLPVSLVTMDTHYRICHQALGRSLVLFKRGLCRDCRSADGWPSSIYYANAFG